MVTQEIKILSKGSVVYLDFNPQVGHEQAGRRPALVVSPASYNDKVGLALVCPITSRVKAYPFEVPIPEGSRVAGVVLADQLKSVDWHHRRAEVVGSLPPETVAQVLGLLAALLEIGVAA
ncbi:MAG: type II toxin-antitoxin system PemK/MazF family toxin [Candidatus Riflebacteria bacterium]|nr:type II toxin-antitoxin system PemK/MazF family toxin [Candidatus Riflebacteria bacterium]